MGAVSTRELNGREIEFGTAGYTYENVFVLYDRESDSVWYPGPSTLEAVGGERLGDKIPFIQEPSPIALEEWLKQQPTSTVLLPSVEDGERLKKDS